MSPGRRAGARVWLTLVALVWAGMVAGISFLEAWVKFRAPSLSLEEGLDVGRHVFGALNLVEMAWATAALALVVIGRPARPVGLAAGVAAGIVALQGAWLLPVLDGRVETLLAGGTPPAAPYHVLYIGLECVKLAALLAVGILSLRAGARTTGLSSAR
jgi:hypothetical protein